jgi:flavin prenyltransferase
MKIAIGITGASGSIYADLLLGKLDANRDQISEVGVVFSSNAKDVWKFELGNERFNNLPFATYERTDFFAPFASGSAGYDALIICPCSMGTMGRIANGISDDLITRAADVMLKERRKLILVARDTPYNLVHLRNMTSLTESGAIICPATPSFYSKPQTLEELALTVVDRVLDLVGIKQDTYRWAKK